MSTTGEGGEPREAGEAGGGGGEAVSSEDVKPKDKEKKVDATQQEQSTATGSTQGTQARPTVGNSSNKLSSYYRRTLFNCEYLLIAYCEFFLRS